MILPYLKITPKIERPIIPIMLKFGDRLIVYQALIDSGADYCIFSIEVAKALGVILETKHKTYFRGVGKEKIQGYWGKVEIRVGDINYNTRAIFAEISEFGHGIVGQRGFFDIFIVKFDLIRKGIEIKPRKISRLPKGTIPSLSKKYSDKKIRDIAIESHINKHKRSLN